MAIQSQKIEPHWNYFLAVERDLDTLARYVEFDARNFDCFSIEIARVLLAAGAEVDVVCKRICRAGGAQTSAENISSYRDDVRRRFPRFPSFTVQIPRFGLTLRPWEEWADPQGVPFWWTAYNKIKHERDSQYHRASLKNGLNAVAGLFVAVLYLNKQKAETGELVPSPQLLRPDDAYFRGVTFGAYESGFTYMLD